MPAVNPGTTGLVAWWSLDEASGNRADSHGGNTLTDNNTVGYAAGKVGNAADFESGDSEYLLCTPASAVPAAAGWTLGAWVRWETVTPQYTCSFGDTDGAEFVGLSISSGYVKINSAGKTPGTSAVERSVDTWYFLVVRWDGTKLYLSLNDVADYDVTPTGALGWADMDCVAIGSIYKSSAACR